MDKNEFKHYRKRLNKTQKEMAQLLGVSMKAVHSYEQGWRQVPPSVERQMFFLVSRINGATNGQRCWDIKCCAPDLKENCPAWEFNSGDLCWFINGTICSGTTQKKWKDKMKICRQCEVFERISNY